MSYSPFSRNRYKAPLTGNHIDDSQVWEEGEHFRTLSRIKIFRRNDYQSIDKIPDQFRNLHHHE